MIGAKIKIVGLVYLAVFVLLCVVFGLFVTTALSAAAPVGFPQALYNFYFYGGVPLLGLACVVVFTFVGGKAASLVSQYFLWGTMLFAFNYAAQILVNIYSLRVMSFMPGLIWLSDYLPSIILCAVLVALLSGWWKADKKVVHAMAWAGVLFSAFMAAYVIYYISGVSDFSETAALYSGGFKVVHAVAVPIGITWLFGVTRSGEVFAEVFSLPRPVYEERMEE